jgi:hypothetical protein
MVQYSGGGRDRRREFDMDEFWDVSTQDHDIK